MQVPIEVIIDSSTKQFTITVGTPPTSALIKKEAGLEKGSGNPKDDKVADLAIEQIIKISEMKTDSLLGKTRFDRVKEVMGTCNSMGVMVEGKQASDAIKDINQGAFKKEIESGKTELTEEEKKKLKEEKERLLKEIETRRAEFTAKAKEIMAQMEGKPKKEIKMKMIEAKIPKEIMDELLPAEVPAAPGAAGKPGAKPSAASAKK